jgi:hypothetical protein
VHSSIYGSYIVFYMIIQVELIEVKRHIDAKSKYVISLQKRGILKEVSFTSVIFLEINLFYTKGTWNPKDYMMKVKILYFAF